MYVLIPRLGLIITFNPPKREAEVHVPQVDIIIGNAESPMGCTPDSQMMSSQAVNLFIATEVDSQGTSLTEEKQWEGPNNCL